MNQVHAVCCFVSCHFYFLCSSRGLWQRSVPIGQRCLHSLHLFSNSTVPISSRRERTFLNWYLIFTFHNFKPSAAVCPSPLISFYLFLSIILPFSLAFSLPHLFYSLSLSACYPVVSMSSLSCSVFKKLISSAIVSRHSAGIDWRLSRKAQTHTCTTAHIQDLYSSSSNDSPCSVCVSVCACVRVWSSTQCCNPV